MSAFAGLIYAKTLFDGEKSISPNLAPPSLIADGRDTATLTLDLPESPAPAIEIQGHARLGRLTWREGKWTASLRAGILPETLLLRVTAPNHKALVLRIPEELAKTDRAQDGTPDFLRLDDANDRHAFRRAFTLLAEAQYFQDPSARPAEINDCAALIRFAYREALRQHDSAWASSTRLPLLPALDSVAKYQYPHTPLGPSLFRTRPGRFLERDLDDGTFLQFADAKTLWSYNSHRIARSLERAQPGDILFFRQEDGHTSFHSMIYLGRSTIRDDGNRYVLYHTGPTGANPGEIRRLTEQELLQFPQPEWRPVASNSAFLGVSRWNILREGADDAEAR